MNVISLEQARSRLRRPRRIEPPAALGFAARPSPHGQAEDAGAERLRMRQNLAAFAVIVVIVVLGTWLMESLQYYSRVQACVEAGHHNCLPLATEYMAAPYSR